MDRHRPGVRGPAGAGPPARGVCGGEAHVSEELVHLEVTGGVATVTLDSPANRNALSRALMTGLEESLDAALADDRARLIVLTGAGWWHWFGRGLRYRRVRRRRDVRVQRGAHRRDPGDYLRRRVAKTGRH